MSTILQARIIYEENQIKQVLVLAKMGHDDIRVISADTQPKGGYMHILQDAKLSDKLIKQVCDYGMEINHRNFLSHRIHPLK